MTSLWKVYWMAIGGALMAETIEAMTGHEAISLIRAGRGNVVVVTVFKVNETGAVIG